MINAASAAPRTYALIHVRARAAARRLWARAPHSQAFFTIAGVLYMLFMYVVIQLVFETELARTGRLNGAANLSNLLADTWEVDQVSLGVAIGFAILASVFAFRITGKVVRALEEVQRIHEAQNEFLSIVSHEFRTPLTGIQGFSELIRDEDLTPELMREYAADINSDARRLSRMIGDMLDAQRLDGGRLQIVHAPVDLNQILRDVARQQSAVAKQHSIVLSLDDGVALVDGDTDRLTQIATNLIANAIKYATPGKITVSAVLEDGQAHLRVSDQGPGIPADSVERIFERYYRVPTADVGLITGTGLGLPIVRGLVELHRGRVWCESSPDSGSVFHVVLPATASNELPA